MSLTFLRSSATDTLLVRPTRLVTVGDQAFPVAAAKLWNELPGDVPASQSLTAFGRQLKTFLVSCIISGFIICTAGRFAIAVVYININTMKCISLRFKLHRSMNLFIA